MDDGDEQRTFSDAGSERPSDGAPMIGALVGLGALMLAPRRAAMLAGGVLLSLLAVGAGWMWKAEQHAGKTRIVAARALALEMQAFAPGSIFPCLSVIAREIRQACESVLFNSPQSIAAAVDYTEAQVDLLIEGRSPAGNQRALDVLAGTRSDGRRLSSCRVFCPT
jgi:hypothetical protein